MPPGNTTGNLELTTYPTGYTGWGAGMDSNLQTIDTAVTALQEAVAPTPLTLTLTAGMNINAFQAISLHSDGLGYQADASTTNDAGHVVGVSTTSATTGNTFTVQQTGEINNPGFLFTPGSPIFLGFSGSLVESLTAGSAFQQPMGVSISSSLLAVEVGAPIVLAP